MKPINSLVLQGNFSELPYIRTLRESSEDRGATYVITFLELTLEAVKNGGSIVLNEENDYLEQLTEMINEDTEDIKTVLEIATDCAAIRQEENTIIFRCLD